MPTFTPPRRSWFAVWRWRWRTWALVILASLPLYLASAQLALDFANRPNRLNLPGWLIYKWCYAPVIWAEDRIPPVRDFLNWEQRVIARERQQWFFFWNPPEPAPPLPP